MESTRLFTQKVPGLEDLPEKPLVFWYVSAGKDFRGPVFLTQQHINKLSKYNGKDFSKPDLFVYNCLGPEVGELKRLIENDQVLWEDQSTSVKATHYQELRLNGEFNLEVDPGYIEVNKNQIPEGLERAFYVELEIKGEGYSEAQKVLYFEHENIDFFQKVILTDNFDVKYLCATREGCGMGGCLKSIIEFIYKDNPHVILEGFKPKFVIPFNDFTEDILKNTGENSDLFSVKNYWENYIHEKYESNIYNKEKSSEKIFRLSYS